MSETTNQADEGSTCSCCGCGGEPPTDSEEPETSESGEGGGVTAVFGTVVGALSLIAIPKCPMCLTAYAGVLSAVGLGFLASAAVLEPLIGAMLVLQVGFVAWSTRSHRNPWPVVATVAGVLAVGLARWVLVSDPLLYVGAVAIIGAAAANFWLMQPRISRLRADGS
ncbi:MAG: MerC family mercury resistance protein [Bradymonadaceae bacterium]